MRSNIIFLVKPFSRIFRRVQVHSSGVLGVIHFFVRNAMFRCMIRMGGASLNGARASG